MSKKNHTADSIAIVGMAAMYPKSPDLKGFWHLIRAGVDGITEIPKTHWRPEDYFDANQKAPDMTYCQRGGFLPAHRFDPTEFSLPPTVLEATDTSQLLGLVVAKAALEDAGYGANKEFKRDTTSVILGVTGTLELVVPLGARLGHPIWRKALIESGLAPELVEEVMGRIAEGYVPWQENSFPGLLGNVVAGRIANRLDLHGTNCVVDAACASSLSAAHLAMLELSTGKADMVITGGADTFNDIFMYMCFSKTPALSASGKIRPFSEASDGTLIGEGLGMVVLKRLSDAKADGDRIYAVVKGVGTASDGNSGAVYAPDSKGQARALRDAYERAGVSPNQIRLVEAHGTGTKVGDVVEFEGLRSVYAPVSGDKKQYVALGTVKSQVGHTKAAAGSASLIKAALALYYKVFPPTLGVEKPNPKMNIEDSPFYINNEARPWVSEAGQPRRAALSSFGFGGSNFHMVLEEAQADRPEVAWDGSLRLWAESNTSPALLSQALKTSADKLPEELNDQARLAHQRSAEFDCKAAARCVIVWNTEKSLKELLLQASQLVHEGKASEGPEIFYAPGSEAGKVVFMFPGQGSQYVNMGRELACIFPEVLESIERSDKHSPEGQPLSARMYPPPTFNEELKKQREEALTATNCAQPALGALNRGVYEILSQRFGLTPDFTCGHSYGELCALYAAGVYDADALCKVSFLRGELMAKGDGGRGGMAAVTAPLEKVEAILPELGPEVVIANRNSPGQCVLSGTKEAVKAATVKLKEHGMRAIPLQVGAAFHSPLVASAESPFRKGLDEVKFGKTNLPVLANKTAQDYPTDAKKMKDLLANQLVSQVNWVSQVDELYGRGARTFVEVGPKNVLTKLVGACLKGKEHKAIALDASGGKTGLMDLAQGLAHLAALGLPVHLGQWETAPAEGRKRKMTVELTGANYRSPQSKKTVAARAPGSVNVLPPVGAKATAPVTPPPQSVAPAPAPAAAKPAPAPVAAAPVVAPAPVVAAPVVSQEAVREVHSSLLAIQALQQQAAQAHHRFLETQETTMKTFQALVQNQQSLMQRLQSGQAPAAVHVPAPAVAPPPRPAAITPAAPAPAPVAPRAAVPAPAPAPAPVAKAPAPVAPAPKPAASGVSTAVLAVVSDKTGYPVEMLNLDMDLEADLGIDSIKRVEILAAVQEKQPQLAAVPSDQMGSLRTLREVVNAFGASDTASPAAAPAAAAPSPGVSKALLEVVAEKTGYPVEMLNLEMDLEGDLGIDSIKRVEILAAIEEKVPGLPKVASDQMGSLRTLGQIVSAFGAVAAPSVPSAPAPGVSNALLEVVAEKTGYPVEMLNLEMDLEADLGIDSIKRVEILAAIEEKVPGLPKVASDQMGSLRTLGQIVSAFGAVAAPNQAPAPAASGNNVSGALMQVVAEKTGYPVEMLNLEMDLEADLGIDSIKRVEILAAIEEKVPGLPKVASDQMGSLRTLGQIVSAFGAVPSAHAPVAAGGNVSAALMQVVAEKTGYPVEMLNLEMDLEADLGIDSIKRVEILAAIEEKVPGLPKVASDQMGSLRTLGQIVSAFGASAAAPLVHATPAPVQNTGNILAIVAEKTGYPVDMLNLDMDLEADLGVDSIKRVEILAAIPEAANIPADHVGSLRTLRQIVEALGGPAPAAPASATSAGLNTSNLLQIVAEKTGYPVEMLNLDMDLEADLGVDSIKRVEILAAVPEASALPADRVGSLRTLRQIVEAIGVPTTAGSAPVAAPVAAASSRLERRILLATALPPLNNGKPFPLSKGSKVMIFAPKDNGLAGTLAAEFKKLGLQVTDKPESDLAGLFLVESPLRESFQTVRSAAAALRAQKGMLVSVARMDGRFGLTGHFQAPESGALTGLPKTAAHEWPEVTCRAFDVDHTWRDDKAVANKLIQEISHGGPLELGLTAGQRFALETPLEEVTVTKPIFSKGDVVLVTGGARGVTAATVIALAKSCQPTLVLLGRSPLPAEEPAWARGLTQDGALKKAILQHEFNGKASPKDIEARFKSLQAQREVHGTLDAIRKAGAKVEYRSLDVRDQQAVSNMLQEVSSSLGPIQGLVHGAGVLADKKIEEKTDEMFDSVFSTKITGLKHLLQPLHDAKLKAIVLFSSVTARFGRPGQVDYCMANDLLNKTAQLEAQRRPGCRVVSLNWGPWGGGMVTEGLKKEFQRLGVGLIELEAGAEAMVRELSAAPGGAVEILYGDGFPAPPGSDKPGGGLLQVVASVEEFPCLESHRVGGRPVVPVALQIEWFAQAATAAQVGQRFRGLRQLQILRPISLENGDVSLQVVQNGEMFELRNTQTGQVHSRAVVDLGSELPEAPSLASVNGLSQQPYPHSKPAIYQDHLFHGPHFHAVKNVSGWSSHGIVAQVGTLPKVSDWIKQPLRSDWLADPLAVDAALQLGILWGIEALGKPSLPMVVGGYQQYQRKFPRGGVEARLWVEKSSPSKIVASVDFVDSQGALVARLSDVEWTADASLKQAFAKEPASSPR
ncbi:SDR family NAD(P)-dependent oxidoreductase [bacterium]|nr:SDR family NAD(P)-dependent oxidoreductase [bacterium]